MCAFIGAVDQHGEGFKTVNSKAPLAPFSPNLPPALDHTFKLGTDCPGTYASEFGASALSSFESVSPTLKAEDWGLHTDPMFERNYCADNFLTVYFNVSWPGFMEKTGEGALKAQLYLAIVAQALVVKSDISTRRARNSFGTVTWQHNEVRRAARALLLSTIWAGSLTSLCPCPVQQSFIRSD